MKMNSISNIIVVFLLPCLIEISQAVEFQVLYLDEPTQIKSEDYGYPLNPVDKPFDKVWQCYGSIKLEIKYFELDGQNGDFLLVSDVPLDEKLLEGTNLGDLPAEDDRFIQSIMVSNGLLMSWGVNQSIQVHSATGAFLYFHAQPPTVDGDRRKLFRGFDITVFDFDALRTTTMRPTPEPEHTTPSPGVQIYLNVFLSCNDPKEFAKEKEDFRLQLALMATKYCTVTVPGGCTDNGIILEPFNATEVSIPDNGIYYCDPQWPVYATCVEVRFAIVRFLDGQYLMTKSRLKDMWEKESPSLTEEGYCPYIPPQTGKLEVWIWVAFAAGMILLFLTLLCVIFIRKSYEDYNRKSDKPLTTSENLSSDGSTFFDRENPILNLISKLLRNKTEDSRYLEIQDELGKFNSEDSSHVKQNQLYMHDNHGFEDVEVELEYPGTNLSVSTFSRKDFMDINGLGPELSDTEI